MRILREGSKVKTIGIIMSGNRPKLILDELKTMTRRTWGLEKINEDPGNWELDKEYQDLNIAFGGSHVHFFCKQPKPGKAYSLRFNCPYGQVGDRLWVRETWRIESFMDGEPMLFSYKDGQVKEEGVDPETGIDYEAWYERVCIESTEEARQAFGQGLVRRDEEGYYRWDMGKSPCRWRPSLFMPRWASRILLEITEIRVERLQEITQDDAVAEGMRHPEHAFKMIAGGDVEVEISPKEQFAELWDSLNAKRGYGWDINPWVWVISFKRIDGQR